MRDAIDALDSDEILETNWKWTDMVRDHKMEGFQAWARINIYLEVRLKEGGTIKLLLDYMYMHHGEQRVSDGPTL